MAGACLGRQLHDDRASLAVGSDAGRNETFAAAVQLARTEGIIPAPDPAHAIRAVIEEALAAREAGDERVILFGLCGHGNFDLGAYDAYFAGQLEDPELSEADLSAALAALPQAPALT